MRNERCSREFLSLLYSYHFNKFLTSWLILLLIGVRFTQQATFFPQDAVAYFRTDTYAKFLEIYAISSFRQQNEMWQNTFSSFSRILLPFNVDETHNFPLIDIMQRAANYNKEAYQNANNASRPAEIWVLVEATLFGDSSKPLRVDYIDRVNAIFPGTVTTLLLLERSALLPETARVNWMAQQQRLSDFLTLNSTNNFNKGVMLDWTYCRCSCTIPKVAANYTDSESVPMYFTRGPSTRFQKEELDTCRANYVLERNNTKLGFVINWPVSYQQSDGQLIGVEEEQKLAQFLQNANFNNITLVLEVEANFVPPDNDKEVDHCLNSDNVTAWLQTPTSFSKEFFDVSISPTFLKHLRFAPYKDSLHALRNIFATFAKITLGPVTADVEIDFGYGMDYNRRFAYNLRLVKRWWGNDNPPSLLSGVDIHGSTVTTSVTVSVQIAKHSMEANRRDIQWAQRLRGTAGVFPRLRLLLDCGWFRGHEELPTNNGTGKAWDDIIVPSIEYANPKREGKYGNVGIIFHLGMCTKLSVNTAHSELQNVSTIAFRTAVSMHTILESPASVLEDMFSSFQRCKENITPNLFAGTEVEFQVSVTGCSMEATATAQEILEFVRVWEKVNCWAVRNKIWVTMATAFDMPEEGEHCGWWNTFSKINENRTVFEDKKKVASALLSREGQHQTCHS